MRLFLIGVILISFVLLLGLFLGTTESVSDKGGSARVRFEIKDLREHGISLLPPSDPTSTNDQALHVDPYSVLLKNASTRAVVGYSIKWECWDGITQTSARDLSRDRIFSHIVGVVFLHGDESDRRSMMNGLDDVIKPNSTWLIANDYPARNITEETNAKLNEAAIAEVIAACPTMTVTADGVFFDDGTFIGPDTTNFFGRVKTQMDARYEVLRGVRNELKSGKSPAEIFLGLEQIRDRERHENGGETIEELRSDFRNLFAQDILGKKEVWGPDKAIGEVQQMLSKPWVNLRKL